jgi:transglutaminase superfamily protein
MADTNIGALRNASGFMRTIAGVVLVSFTTVTLSPSVHAMQQYATQLQTRRQVAASDSENAGSQLARAKEQLRLLADKPLPVAGGRPTAEQRRAAKDALRAWRADYRALRAKVQDEFDATGQLLEHKNLPDVIKQRHEEAVAKFQSESDALESDIDAALSAPDEATVQARAQAAFERLDKTQLHRSQQEFDPNNLPNSSLKADPNRKPKLTPEEFQAALLVADPAVRLAQASGFDFSQLPGASDPSDLGATTEIALTPDIQAKAEELHRNPVEIHNWVRNNVHWQPTWGAIQDASHTLSSQRGNAFDIASLTIALLRASGIPARYVHGTIDVPEDKFRNWAGGFQHIEAAMDFASAGGLPLTAVTSAGRVAKIRMEHIWVEAAVDFHPSRGMKNLVADSWVAMDPSFKQVEILPGLDAVRLSGIDSKQLAETFLASGTVNDAEGWGTGFDPAILQNAQNAVRESLRTYVEQNLPDATVDEVLGGKRILAQHAPVLATGLPNRIVVNGARYASIPMSLEQQITFAFGKDIDGEPINPLTLPWAKLNNRQVTLSFMPATQADADAVQALIPGGITDIAQFPSSIPAYLIRVVPELRVGTAVVSRGASMTLGTEIDFVFNSRFVSAGTKPFSYKVIAGSYLAIAVVSGTLNAAETVLARTRLVAIAAVFERGNLSEVAALTRENVIGEMFHAGILAYFGHYDSVARAAAQTQSAHHVLAAGIGSFGYEPRVEYFFGIPRSLRHGGAGMNVPIVNIVGHEGTDNVAEKRAFSVQIGALSSSLEHAVPEQMFPSGTGETTGISAVKALGKAASAGQRIYEITQSNRATVLPLIHHDQSTLQEISNALAAGKVVITHTAPVSVPGWAGAGYVIMDPDTGAAAWKIAGGANGGYLQGLVIGFFLIQALALAIITDPLTVAHLAALASIIANSFAAAWLGAPDTPAARCFVSGLLVGAGIGLALLAAQIPAALVFILTALGIIINELVRSDAPNFRQCLRKA